MTTRGRRKCPGGNLAKVFRLEGVTLRHADCLIAAAGIGATLATANVDDFPMNEIEVQHWSAGA